MLPKEPIVPRSTRAEPQTPGAVLGGRFVPAMFGPCRPASQSPPAPPAIFSGRGLCHGHGSCRAPCKSPNLPCRPRSPPFGGVRATRAARNVRLQQPAKLGWTISDRALYRKREPVGPGAVAWRECVAPLHRDGTRRVVPGRDGSNRASRSHCLTAPATLTHSCPW